VTNSALAGNSAFAMQSASEGGGAYLGNLENCNITGNTAADGGGTFDANQVNCINYFNTLYTNGPMIDGPYTANYWGSGTITYSCTSPNPHYAGDITNDPQLASFSHISLSSPCRGAGTASASTGVDLDSNSWSNPPSMGCFEPHPGSVLGNLSVGISTLASNWAPGYELNFEANISGPVYSNLWGFGDGTFVTNEAYTSHTWSATGIYPVTLTAYNDSYPAGVTTTLVINVAVPRTFYVNLNNRNPFPPYLNWNTAAISIQDAVNVAGPGSVVLVTNGPTLPIYPNFTVTNSAAVYLNGGAEAPNGYFYRVMVTNPITVESVSGPSSTYILGGTSGGGYEVGCVYLTDGATLSGFMLANGIAEFGGGICAASTNAFATNCVITGCAGSAEGGSVYLGTLWNCLIEHNDNFGAVFSMLNYCTLSGNSQGGAEQCILNNCTLTGNSIAEQSSLLNNCVISSNSAAFAAGAYGGTLNNCLIVSNTAADGAGAYGAEYYPVVLNNCVISNNTAYAGAAAYGELLSRAAYCFMTNCIVIHNSASGGAVYGAQVDNCELIGNAGVGASESTLNQCTLSQNSAARGGAASLSSLTDCLIISNSATDGFGGGVVGCSLTNCILTYNASPSGGGGAGPLRNPRWLIAR
ncbi:MAG TPA: PKD domain-containing protein, partial [Verrucomicrobiae bacterium]|nr:PKD domain-containing protein [Verrucomicrobiae bacterium]